MFGITNRSSSKEIVWSRKIIPQKQLQALISGSLDTTRQGKHQVPHSEGKPPCRSCTSEKVGGVLGGGYLFVAAPLRRGARVPRPAPRTEVCAMDPLFWNPGHPPPIRATGSQTVSTKVVSSTLCATVPVRHQRLYP